MVRPLTASALPVAAAGAVFVAAVVLYVRTLLPDVGTWDTAEFQAIGPVLGIAHPTGYPTYTLLAWLASVVLQPFGNEAYRADLLSALLVAGAAALLSVRVVQATRRWPLGVVARARVRADAGGLARRDPSRRARAARLPGSADAGAAGCLASPRGRPAVHAPADGWWPRRWSTACRSATTP